MRRSNNDLLGLQPAPLVIAAALLSFSAGGCLVTPTKTVTITRTLEQTGAIIAPSIPKGGGAPLDEGQLALEGGMTFATGDTPDKSRYQEKSGNVYNDKALHGRIAIGASDNVELGFGFDYASASWGTISAANDTTASDITFASSYWSVTPHLRAFLFRNENSGFAINTEMDITQASHRRDVYEKAYETTFTGGVADKTNYIGRRITSKNKTRVYPIFRVGLFGYGQIGDLTLGGGAAVQNMPVFFGTKRADFQCTYYDTTLNPDGQPDYINCQGVDDTEEIDASSTTAVYTLHFTAAYALGPVTFQGQVATHLSPNEAYQVLPFRFDLSLRYTFDLGWTKRRSAEEIRTLYKSSQDSPDEDLPDHDGDEFPLRGGY
jgi:hypothetical protein